MKLPPLSCVQGVLAELLQTVDDAIVELDDEEDD